MKRILIFGLTFLLSSLHLTAQKPLCSETLSINFEFGNENSSIRLLTDGLQASGSYIRFESFYLKGPDLYMRYQTIKQKDGFKCKLMLSVKWGEEWDIIPLRNDLAGDLLKAADGSLGEIVWRDFFEDYGSLLKKYELLITVDLFGETHVRCDEMLTHPFNENAEKVVLITGLTAGVGLLGAGQISRISANRNQRTYRSKWLNGNTFSDSQELNLAAQNQKKNYQTLTILGGATLIGAGIYWWLRDRHFRKDKREFEKYCDCQKLIVFEPYMDSNNLSDFASLGLSMKIKIR